MLVRRPLTSFDLSPAAFDRTFQQLVAGLSGPTSRRPGPVVRASSTGGTLTLTVDLPGVPAEAVGVEVADRVLTLQAAHNGSTWSHRSRLGTQYDLDSVSANYVDGRLTVTVGTAPAAEARKIAVSTTAAVVEAVESGEATAEVAAGEVSEG